MQKIWTENAPNLRVTIVISQTSSIVTNLYRTRSIYIYIYILGLVAKWAK